MTKNRLEAFSDGVIAIIITIMVLELKVPHGIEWADLIELTPVFSSYLMSFVFLGIYWNNHHHLIHTAQHVNGAILWANLHLLLWLSLMPFVTAWIGENHFAPAPVAAYGVVALMAGVAYYILTRVLIARHGVNSTLARAVGFDRKGLLSLALYAGGVGIASTNRWVAVALYLTVSVMWLVPDRRIERLLNEE